MSELTTVARPYALAAFDFAVDKSAVDEWQAMLVFAAEVSKAEEMHHYLSGAVSSALAIDVFNKVCGDQLNENGQNFIKILAVNHRLALLPEISTMFSALKIEREKQINVDVTSAAELNSAQLDALSASLEKRFDRKVQLNCSVDPSLIAGMIIKAGDTVIDGSVNSQLNRLNDALQA
ncbi:F0F1 ATP synthase subunit delta [Glaciecola sp. XM2]|jgi:F-type H+-transporting ATPase subunit delta|uniref:F0F1 ATP synthase subunit delta n=1 Tax=Glaciecola sp. XM2 TaxID=1914931 RepID=UPI001BDEC54F|nr:F0F1 ATP synthase subunit delta [Glaciecola sp. XM2]MBT1451572.1 F0F1 ATP synthase subunit delta [Glaciecola sp. XM2]